MMSTINHVTWYIMFWLPSNPLKCNHVLSIVPTSPPQAVSKKFFTSAWETCKQRWTFYWEKIKIDWESSKSTTITTYACIMHMTTMMGIIQNRDAVIKSISRNVKLNTSKWNKGEYLLINICTIDCPGTHFPFILWLQLNFSHQNTNTANNFIEFWN